MGALNTLEPPLCCLLETIDTSLNIYEANHVTYKSQTVNKSEQVVKQVNNDVNKQTNKVHISRKINLLRFGNESFQLHDNNKSFWK